MGFKCQLGSILASKITKNHLLEASRGVFGRLVGVLAASWAVLEASWRRLAESRRLLGHVLGAPGAVWTGFGDPRTPERPPGGGDPPMEIHRLPPCAPDLGIHFYIR